MGICEPLCKVRESRAALVRQTAVLHPIRRRDLGQAPRTHGSAAKLSAEFFRLRCSLHETIEFSFRCAAGGRDDDHAAGERGVYDREHKHYHKWDDNVNRAWHRGWRIIS